jgi:sortase A
MALMEKKRYQGNQQQGRRYRRRAQQKKRRRMGFYVFVVLAVLTLGAFILFGTDLTSQEGGVVERVEEPTLSEVPETGSEEPADEEKTAEDEEERPPPPDNPTMYLSIPKLGISDTLVLDDVSEEGGLAQGVGHLPGTGFPWLEGANTYIAGHRIGYPGTPSDHIFYNLPSLTEGDEITLRDTNDEEYTYRVTEVFTVTPFDLWVMDPVAGKDTVTLQVCTESLDDWWTIGPSLMSSGPESGRLMVRGELVD